MASARSSSPIDRRVAFQRALEAPRTDMLFFGTEKTFIQFGGISVRGRCVMLLGVVTNCDGSRRAFDRLLETDSPPHLTVGHFADGAGKNVEDHSTRTRWRICAPPVADPGLRDVLWSHDVEEDLDATALARRIDEQCLGWESEVPVEADICFDLAEHEAFRTVTRFWLVGGRALEMYRDVQLAYEVELWNSIGLVRVTWSVFFGVSFKLMLRFRLGLGVVLIALASGCGSVSSKFQGVRDSAVLLALVGSGTFSCPHHGLQSAGLGRCCRS